MALVQLQQFTYTYPGEPKPALLDINLAINSGAFVVITGESGSGKSTLGKAIAGFLFQDEEPNFSGKIVVNGTDMSRLPLFDASERVTYVQQNPEDQFCTLTVRDEIAFGLENHCLDPVLIEEHIDKVLEIVNGLNLKDRDLATLSGGEKQKIAIASMLALSPDVIILDEPTSNLDPISTKHIFQTLRDIQKTQDLCVMIIEHKLSQLEGMRPIIYEMDDGHIKSFNLGESQNLPDSVDNTKENLHFSEFDTKNSQGLIELSGVTVWLGESRILKDINLTLSPGEFVALMGANGSGKSTLLETIMGFHPIKSGIFKIFNHDHHTYKTSQRVREVGYIFQNPDHQLFTQSVWEETTLTSKNLGIPEKKHQTQAEEWLTLLKLDDRAVDHPQRLSYGEKRRLNLAATILHQPKLLLIDELLIGQDMTNAHAWMSLLNDYVNRGHSVFLVIHHAELTREYCDRIVFLENGKIIVDDTTTSAFQALEDHGHAMFCPSGGLDQSYA